MVDSTLDPVRAELGALRRKVRWLQAGLVLLLVGDLIQWGLLPEPQRRDRIVLMDGAGDRYVMLGDLRNGSFGLAVGSRRTPYAQVAIAADGEPGVKLVDPAGSMELGVNGDGFRGLALYEDNDRRGLALGRRENGFLGLGVFGADSSWLRAGADPQDNPLLEMWDKQGRLLEHLPARPGQHGPKQPPARPAGWRYQPSPVRQCSSGS